MDTRTRVIATVGPACDSEEALSRLIAEGVDVFRLNFSHGTHEEHAMRIAAIKHVREEAGSSVAILLDTKGPEIRTGTLPGGPIDLRDGDNLVLVPAGVVSEGVVRAGTEGPVSIGEPVVIDGARSFFVAQTYPELASFVTPGTRILLDDGKVELDVTAVKDGTDVICRVLNSATLGERKSVNVPGVAIPLPILSKQDEADLLFGIEHDVDFVAASFVRTAEDVKEIRAFLKEHGGEDTSIVAKIESRSAIDNIDAIIRASDGVMVARGDLGVEMPAHEVPHLQKKIIAKCNHAHRPVITATQMLESMTESPRPTRAEAADVANAIYDGTDCVMLSGETAAGKYPIEAVRTMSQIVDATEHHIFESGGWHTLYDDPVKSVSHAVGSAAVKTAEDIRAKCLICPTMTGRTARLMSSLRPPMPIYAVAPSARTLRRMQIFWGVESLLGDVCGDMRRVIDNARDVVVAQEHLKVGDVAVITCGDRFTSPIARDANGQPEKFAPANVMYVIQVHNEDVERRIVSEGEGALMSRSFFNLSYFTAE